MFLVSLVLSLATAAGAITGTVRSVDGVPIAGARVVVVGERAETMTGSAGEFFLADVVPPAVIEVSARGFASVRVTVRDARAEFVLEPAVVTESVIVSAARGNTGTWREPATGTTVLTRDDLDRIPGVTLDESLRVVSGFSLFRRSSARAANPTTHGVTLRGLSASGASRGLVLLDGVPLNDGFGGWVTWTRVPALVIERVDVDRGPQGDAFGTDALGGVLRIVTPSASDAVTLAGDIGSVDGTMSLGLAAVDGAAGTEVGRAHLLGAAGWLRTDGTIPLEPASRGAVDRATDAEWWNLLGRATLSAASGRRLTLSAWGGRDDRGNGTVLQRNTMSGGTAALTFEAIGPDTTLAGRVSHSPNRFRQTFTSVAASRATEMLTSTQTTETATTRAVAEVGRIVPHGFVLVRVAFGRASADFEEVRPTGTTAEALRDDSDAVSVQGSFTPVDRLTVGGGLRHEWRAAPRAADARDSATVGQATATLRVAGRVHARAALATSHRWPTLNELVRGFRVGAITTLPNADLLPERAWSAEGAFVVEGRRWMASAGVFRSRVDGAIANVTLSATQRQRRNAGEARAVGAEFDGEMRWRGLRIRGSMSVTDATFHDSLEPLIEGRRLPQVPRVSGSMAADVALQRRMTASVVWRGVSSQFDDDRNLFRLAEAWQTDVRVAGREGPVGWHLSFENLFNSRIEVGRTPLVTLAPGRAVRIGVSWRR